MSFITMWYLAIWLMLPRFLRKFIAATLLGVLLIIMIDGLASIEYVIFFTVIFFVYAWSNIRKKRKVKKQQTEMSQSSI